LGKKTARGVTEKMQRKGDGKLRSGGKKKKSKGEKKPVPKLKHFDR